MKVLDLGCGEGRSLDHVGVSEFDTVVGVDVIPLANAARRFAGRSFVQARAEVLPFADASFERVVCLLAMPYMNIPAAVREIHRILVDGGSLRVTVHPYYFTWRELIHNALPRPAATLYRLWVMLNGIIFHFTGRLLIFRGRCESFQTKRSITRALADAGFHVKFIGRAFQHFERIDITAVKVDSADVN